MQEKKSELSEECKKMIDVVNNLPLRIFAPDMYEEITEILTRFPLKDLERLIKHTKGKTQNYIDSFFTKIRGGFIKVIDISKDPNKYISIWIRKDYYINLGGLSKILKNYNKSPQEHEPLIIPKEDIYDRLN